MYDDVRSAASPSATLLDFCQSTYEAGLKLGKWGSQRLEQRSFVFHPERLLKLLG